MNARRLTLATVAVWAAALTIGLDALLRRRARKQGEKVAVPAPGPDRDPTGVTAPIVRPAIAQAADPEATRSLWLPGRKASDGVSPLTSSTVTGDEPRNGANGGRRVPSGESTIVLPNIHGSVYGRRDNDQDPE